MTHVVVLVGSLRADSVNRQIAESLRELAPGDTVIDIVDGLGDLPFYNEDVDGGGAPAAVTRVRELVGRADRVLAVTPEYNATMIAVLNNAIDWLSRPYGVGALTGKPFGVVGVTPTPYGGKWPTTTPAAPRGSPARSWSRRSTSRRPPSTSTCSTTPKSGRTCATRCWL